MVEDNWPETPEEERIRARLVDGRMVDFKDLRRGDVFQAMAPDGRGPLHPVTLEPDTETFAYCDGEPAPNGPHGQGYAVPVYDGPLEQLRKQHMS